MSEERKKVLERLEERLARLESEASGRLHDWKRFHLHNALNALESDHNLADLHLTEFDRANLEKEFPEMEADRVPSVEELRARYDSIAGGML